MDTLMQGLVALAAALVSAAVPILLPYLLNTLSSSVHNKDIALIGGAAARAAGRVAVGVADQMARPGASLKAAVAAAVAAEVAVLRGQLPEVIAKVGASDATLASMITGEVGKLVAARLEAPTQTIPATIREFVPRPGGAGEGAGR